MPEKISRKEVEKIAALARIELSQEEIIKFGNELSAILGYIKELQEVDTDNTPITSQVTGLSNVMREDKVQAYSDPQKLVEAAPEHEDGLIRVKAVFDN